MNTVKLAIIGVGNMGQSHCRLLRKIAEIDLVAVCDIDKARAHQVAEKFECRAYTDPASLLRSHCADAILIATPHYDHTTLGVRALRAGYHVLVEKPISVHKADCEKLIRTHTNPAQKFAAMFNQRTNRHYQHIRHMIGSGELGRVRRMQWTITDWFRSQGYYDSGGWRATWAEEGGGVLMNQCPHQLDLLQWLFGMPTRVHAHCHVGRHHHIEVEDEVTAYLEFGSGATGVFTTTTGETPGANRLEIAGDNGMLIHDANEGIFRFTRNEKSVERAIAENGGFEKPPTEVIDLDIEDTGRQHAEVLENFAAAILRDEPLIARAEEGIASVELANAMLLSGWTGKAIEMPLNARTYANRLRKQIRESTFVKPSASGTVATDMDSSF